MKVRHSINSLFRSPIRTALTVVLTGVVAFALLSQAAEFSITRREMERTAAHYYGAGSVEIAPPTAGTPASEGVAQVS
ncbi:MAG: hypothetical protein FWG48_02995 [Oscillospiraceae bacterium]|nr:hypothetical protein [Oscillospiraceae bacterium]